MPDARRAPIASRVKGKTHEQSHHRYAGSDPAFPARWF